MAEDEKKVSENITVSVTLPSELHKLVVDEAESEDRSISQQVKRIIRLYYESKEK